MIEQKSQTPESHGGPPPQNLEPAPKPKHAGIPPLPPPPPPSKYRWIWWVAFAIAAVLVYLNWSSISKLLSGPPPATKGSGKKGGKGGAGDGPVPVVATKATRGNVGVYFTAVASVTPIYTTTMQSRVVGELMQIHYNEGDMVKKGDPLIEIDDRPYVVALESAQGQLAKDQASLDNARVDQTRYEGLLKDNAIPEQQLATQVATVKSDEGIVKADQAAIDSARLNITYCHIAAPITGKLGLRLVDPGNIVQTTSNLVVITQMDPISVIFSLPQGQLQPVLDRLRAGQKLTADAYDASDSTKLATGVLSTIDNEIDQSTGTLRLRATFDNKNNALFPNQMVNVRLLVQEKTGVVLLNSAAIQRSTNAVYVFLVKPDNTVTQRDITLGAINADQQEITSGLNAGDTVVMTGVDRLQEGSKVTVQFPGQQSGGNGASAGQSKTGDTSKAGKKSGKSSKGGTKQ